MEYFYLIFYYFKCRYFHKNNLKVVIFHCSPWQFNLTVSSLKSPMNITLFGHYYKPRLIIVMTYYSNLNWRCRPHIGEHSTDQLKTICTYQWIKIILSNINFKKNLYLNLYCICSDLCCCVSVLILGCIFNFLAFKSLFFSLSNPHISLTLSEFLFLLALSPRCWWVTKGMWWQS